MSGDLKDLFKGIDGLVTFKPITDTVESAYDTAAEKLETLKTGASELAYKASHWFGEQTVYITEHTGAPDSPTTPPGTHKTGKQHTPGGNG